MQPTLWHIPISHYSEKVRWALDHKRIPHRRRAVLGGRHPLVAMVLTRGEHQTAPVMTIDGRGIGDSTAIIAELEARYPERPLYPADPAERARALELEEWFDEELGPAIGAPFGRVRWAGTEHSTTWTTYSEGAVRAGERAARDALAAL